ncbi:MAG: formate/nitrite transporter family protein [Candidatus Nomurabacteria bacterium]|jgi:formate/nitrite transporter|nr:formate/nitrite transporter family protein [Candidatus Nomurabacteria bacterium]
MQMKEYHKVIAGKFKQNRGQVWSRSILAGVVLSCAGLISVIATALFGNLVLSSLLFSFGLVMIILLGAELFTSNCLVVLRPRQPKIFSRLAVVYIFNLLGVVIITTFLWGAGLLESYQDNLLSSATTKANLTPVAMLFSGAIANFLVCIASWLGTHEKGSTRIFGIILPIMTFVMIKAEHSIANMFIFAAAIFTSGHFELAYLNNLLWVTIGNTIGGFLFALILYFAYKGQK